MCDEGKESAQVAPIACFEASIKEGGRGGMLMYRSHEIYSLPGIDMV